MKSLTRPRLDRLFWERREIEGISVEQHVSQRYGAILEPDRFGKMASEWVDAPVFAGGVAYEFRADTGIVPKELEAVSKHT